MNTISAIIAIDYQIFPLAALAALGSIILAVTSIWQYRSKQIATVLIWYLTMVGLFLIANTIELLATSGSVTIIAAKTSHMFFLGLGLAWLAFGFYYGGFPHLVTWKNFRWFTIIPVIISSIVWTNEQHGLFWQSTGITAIRNFTVMQPTYGPWFWLYGIFLYVVLIGGVLLMVTAGASAQRVVRRQTLLISMGALIPILFNLIYVFRVFPGLRKDYTPIAFALAGILFYLSVHRYNLFRILPINRHIVLEDVHSAVIVLDNTGTVMDVNSYTEQLLDISSRDILGFPIIHHPVLYQILSEVPLDARLNFETTRTLESESLQHLYIWIQPVYQKKNQLQGTVITIQDVTSWNALLQERNNAITELQTERIRLLELQMMLQRQERLSTIGQLAANMAHEISNPLTFINSGIDELERRTPSPAGDQTMLDIREGLRRISHSVQSLLQYARGVSRTADPVPVPFREIVAKSATLVSPAMEDAVLTVDIPEDTCIRCRSSEISQVLVNLLLNAAHAANLQHTGDGESVRPWVRISAAVHGEYLNCRVSNSGPEIPQEIRGRIFEPFYTTKQHAGTGLGLSICKKIIENGHDGRLYLEPGMPTTFVIELRCIVY